MCMCYIGIDAKLTFLLPFATFKTLKTTRVKLFAAIILFHTLMLVVRRLK